MGETADRVMYFSETYLEKIAKNLEKMGEAELRVARFIMEHKEDCAKMSIKDMARQCSSSSATIVRFCKLLGYSGYTELKFQIQKVYSDFSSNNFSIAAYDDPKSMKRKALQFTQFNLSTTVEKSNDALLERAAARIVNADHVLLSAMGNASGVATAAANLLLSAGINASFHAADALQMKTAAFLKEQDVVIGINYDGYAKAVADTFLVAKKSGATTILITSFSNTLTADYADIILYTPVRDNSNILNFTTTCICQMMIIQLLLVVAWQQSGAVLDKKSAQIRAYTEFKRYTPEDKGIARKQTR